MQVTIYDGQGGAPVAAEFEVPPRVGEEVFWHNATVGGNAWFTVTTSWHEQSTTGGALGYSIWIAPSNAPTSRALASASA